MPRTVWLGLKPLLCGGEDWVGPEGQQRLCWTPDCLQVALCCPWPALSFCPPRAGGRPCGLRDSLPSKQACVCQRGHQPATLEHSPLWPLGLQRDKFLCRIQVRQEGCTPRVTTAPPPSKDAGLGL